MSKTTAAAAFLAATRRFLSLPDDPDARLAEYAALQQEWRRLFSKLLKAADPGDPDIWFALGHGYANGWGTSRDILHSAAWFRRAADAGHAEAMVRLALSLGRPGSSQDMRAAILWLNRAASKGNASAMVHLGFAYREGQGVPVDAETAVNWFIKAFEAGDDHSAVHAGRVFLRHLARPKDALLWFRKAADKGCKDSYVELAMLHDEPSCGLCDHAEAVKWYQTTVARRGSSVPRALFALARHYRDGTGVPQSKDIAKAWLNRLLSETTETNAFRRRGERLLRAVEKPAKAK